MTVTEREQTVAAEMHEAAQRFAAAFDAFSRNGGGDAPGWLVDRRTRAFARFAEVGFPSTHEEAWRFTDPKPLARTAFERAPSPAGLEIVREAVALAFLGGPDAIHAVFVNGTFVPALSRLDGIPDGVRIGGLRDVLSGSPDLLEAHLGQHARDDRTPFAALNTAFLDDGALVYVPYGVVLDRPVHVLFLSTVGHGDRTLSHPRMLVVAEPDARAAIIESYHALGEGVYWTNAVTEIVMGEQANLDVYRVVQESDLAYHTGLTHSHQARTSNLSLTTLTFGGHLVRHDIHSVLDGEGADCTIDGLSMMRGRQHVDYHTTLEHAQPNCTSWEYFNGIFDERSRGVFTGRIIVRPGAQKTDSKQTNNNLLLSEHARADSQPQLEIYADDVKCTHGATLGPIDGEHLFYLQSRGLSVPDARALLTYGFASEILTTVKLEVLRNELDGLVQQRLAEIAHRGS